MSSGRRRSNASIADAYPSGSFRCPYLESKSTRFAKISDGPGLARNSSVMSTPSSFERGVPRFGDPLAAEDVVDLPHPVHAARPLPRSHPARWDREAAPRSLAAPGRRTNAPGSPSNGLAMTRPDPCGPVRSPRAMRHHSYSCSRGTTATWVAIWNTESPLVYTMGSPVAQVLLPELGDDLGARGRHVAQHRMSDRRLERVDDLWREPVRVQRERLIQLDAHHLPVARGGVLAGRSLRRSSVRGPGRRRHRDPLDVGEQAKAQGLEVGQHPGRPPRGRCSRSCSSLRRRSGRRREHPPRPTSRRPTPGPWGRAVRSSRRRPAGRVRWFASWAIAPGARVRGVVDLAQMLPRHEGVDLGGRDARVTQQLLDDPNVGTSFEQMRREGVPERVQRDAAIDARRPRRSVSSRRAQLCRVRRPPRRFRNIAPRLRSPTRTQVGLW